MPAGGPVLSGVEERLAPLKTWLFPSRVFVQLDDRAITGFALDGQRLLWCERVPLPAGLCEQGEPRQVDSLGDLLGDLLVERGFAGARVEAVLPAAACQWRLVRWPDGGWPDDPQRLLAQHEAALELRAPLPYLDLHLVPLALAPPTTLTVAVSSQLLERWIEVFAQAGASLVRAEAAQLCVCRALAALVPELLEAEAIALLQLEPQGASLLILEAGVPCYERSLPPLERGPALAQGLGRALQYWRQERRQAAVPRLLCHGSALPEGVDRAELAIALGCPVQVLDPLAGGWLLAEPPPEGQQRPPGAALLPLWGLLAGESALEGRR